MGRTPLSCASSAAVGAHAAQAPAIGTRYVRFRKGGTTASGILDGDTIREVRGSIFGKHEQTGATHIVRAIVEVADPALDARPERFADLHVLSRYPQAHLLVDLPCSDSGCPRVYTRARRAQASQRPQGRFLVRTVRLITSRLQAELNRRASAPSMRAGF